MTEQEWLAAIEPRELMHFVTEGNSRKLRLFACACCRRAWNPFVNPFTIRTVMAVEAFADGEIGPKDLERVHEAAGRAAATARNGASRDDSGYLAHVAEAAASAAQADALIAVELAFRAAARAAADAPAMIDEQPGGRTGYAEYKAELAEQADLLRDIFGNPFQSLEIQLEWLTSDVIALAHGIYSDRAFDRMPILADALQDAGCDDDDILNHCREAREHVRGCWVVDLLLSKE
jgi:hypothetical protein